MGKTIHVYPVVYLRFPIWSYGIFNETAMNFLEICGIVFIVMVAATALGFAFFLWIYRKSRPYSELFEDMDDNDPLAGLYILSVEIDGEELPESEYNYNGEIVVFNNPPSDGSQVKLIWTSCKQGQNEDL